MLPVASLSVALGERGVIHNAGRRPLQRERVEKC